ncbi:MAG: penicillin-binding transpeptidase domain-containing protein [Chloroflexota bacterium]
MKTVKTVRWILCFCLALAWGCAVLPASAPHTTQQLLPTLSLPQGEVPDVTVAVRAYLDAWKSENYGSMYTLLTSLSQNALSQEKFIDVYSSVATEAALDSIDYEILSVLVNPETAQVRYRVVLHSILVGDISRETLMNLSLEAGQWRVQWDYSLILPDLKDGNYLLMDRRGYVPSRANIYDRRGRALVAQADATALGLYPDEVEPSQAETLFARLAELTGLRVDTIRTMYENAPIGADWYLPLGEVSSDKVARQFEQLIDFNGLVMRSYKSRYYFEGGIAPHVVGYVSAIQPDEVDAYRRKGYLPDERVGRSGLEQWGESYLAGQRGGALYVFNAQGQPMTRLAERDSRASQAVYTTLERDFQLAAQQAISSFPGAIVVLERDTGRVLAMVSSPSFDPNAFEPVNFNSNKQLSEISADPSNPLLNRATQGQYPLGSVFKIITMAAALESGKYTPETTYQCGYTFEELPNAVLYDWTYTYGGIAPSGLLNLSQGLMRSCNPYFWHIGLDLYNQGLTQAVSNMARNFGLGKPTGIVGLEELAGNIPDPQNQVDAVNMAIGQGDVLVSPLQVATFAAAIGNGGTLYRPQVVEQVAPPDGNPVDAFKPQINGTLPLKPETLKALQDAMLGVIRNEQPRGTAWHRFTGLDIKVSGKTGTAQSGGDRPHAWFAGYTFEERLDRPDIAIAVVVEYKGEGSDYAAPIFRRIVELYFIGQPQKLYWWESAFNVTPTLSPSPTPLETISPEVEVTSAP